MSNRKISILCFNFFAICLLSGCGAVQQAHLENANLLVAKPAKDISYLSSILLPSNSEEQITEENPLEICGQFVHTLTPFARAQNSSQTTSAWFTIVEGYQTEHVNPSELISISSKFGKRGRNVHNGIDIRAPKNTEILALMGGTVTHASRNGAYGLMVDIEHKDGTMARYAHMEKILVNKGDVIIPGMVIGLVGRTGRATGNHLHIEIHENNAPINPNKYLTSTEQVLRLSDSSTQVAKK